MLRTKAWLPLICAVLLYAVPVAFGAGLACITVPKLITMAQIEGWLPGARRSVVRIAARWHAETGRDTGYWVSWGEGDVRVPGNHRLDLREDEWQTTKIGDTLEITYAGADRFDVYRRGGVFTETGNFILDSLLLLLEGWLIWLGGRRIFRLMQAVLKVTSKAPQVSQ